MSQLSWLFFLKDYKNKCKFRKNKIIIKRG